MNLNIQSPQDINYLRQLLASGAISEADLQNMNIGGSSNVQNQLPAILNPPAPPQQQFDYQAPTDTLRAQGAQFVRNENTGQTIPFGPGGMQQPQQGFVQGQPQGYPQGMQGQGNPQMPNPSAAYQTPQIMPNTAGQGEMRVIGTGNGTTVDLGTEPARAVPIDYTQAPIDIPGVGRAYKGKDGNAYVSNPDGSKTKVLLGYDMQGSMQLTNQKLAQEQAGANIARTNEEILTSRQNREMAQLKLGVPGLGLPQALLEMQYGKAPEGMMWTQDGKAVAIQGGPTAQKAQAALETGANVLNNIDVLIGKRDASGKLITDQTGQPVQPPHPGFTSAVGMSVPKLLGAGFIPSTQTGDFEERLKQITGGAAMQALDALKGGGVRLSEGVLNRATSAITRMNNSQSPEEFVKAAQEFKGIVQNGMQRAQEQLGGQTQTPQVDPITKMRALSEAKVAVAQGRSRMGVAQRLQQMGIDPAEAGL